MSRRTRYYCDVCNKNLFRTGIWYFFRATIFTRIRMIHVPFWNKDRVDICDRCWEKFKTWVNKT